MQLIYCRSSTLPRSLSRPRRRLCRVPYLTPQRYPFAENRAATDCMVSSKTYKAISASGFRAVIRSCRQAFFCRSTSISIGAGKCASTLPAHQWRAIRTSAARGTPDPFPASPGRADAARMGRRGIWRAASFDCEYPDQREGQDVARARLEERAGATAAGPAFLPPPVNASKADICAGSLPGRDTSGTMLIARPDTSSRS